MLTDEVKIKLEAGSGGDGLVSFRHEKFKPKGGPDGGDGGKGGDIIFEVDKNINTLNFYNTRKEFKASDGQAGRKNCARGKNGHDLILKVPPGTIVYDLNKKSKLKDLKNNKEQFLIAKGGNGGWGNHHFTTSTDQAPKKANPGQPGEKKKILLELQLIADVGLIGLPNTGKSSLLSRISQAHPKIANYPFTTLEPNLGVAQVDDFCFVVADIPGLIKGASKGKGLGDKFLRHIKRTKVLVHLLESKSKKPMQDYKIIRSELKKFSSQLITKPEIVCISKVDLLTEKKQRQLYAKVRKLKPIFISTFTSRGIKDLLYEIKKKLEK